MSNSNLSEINLNLLKALDALLMEQNVSKAGAKLGLTQSAMSLALKQLREVYQDDLLVRGQQGKMSLTPFAKNLITPVRQALRDIETIFVSHLPFEASTSQRTFHIGMSDYIGLVLLPSLMRAITQFAPHVKIVQHAINYLDSLQPFEDLGLDLVIGDFLKFQIV